MEWSSNLYFTLSIWEIFLKGSDSMFFLGFYAGTGRGIGEDGNLVRYNNCEFSENSAVLYGGGLVLFSPYNFQSQEEIQAIELISW